MTKPYCKIVSMPGEPVMIYGFIDRERPNPSMVYVLDNKGYIIRGSQQEPLTMNELDTIDGLATEMAEEFRLDSEE